MYAIEKTFRFSASHRLAWLPTTHPCNRGGELHGHNYEVTLRYEAEQLDAFGFVIDTHALLPFRAYIEKFCDGRELNASLPGLDGQITGERLAEFFADIARAVIKDDEATGRALTCVTVSETDSVAAQWWAGP